MKKLTIILSLGLLSAGCGSGAQPGTNSTTKTETTTSAAETGVPACDEYLAQVEKFVIIRKSRKRPGTLTSRRGTKP